jgi:hypothetical protein
MNLRNKIKSKKFSAPRRLRVLLVTLLFLLIPVVTYFTLYISNQTSYFTNRNFRQLASIGVQIEDRIDNLKDAYRNAVANALKEQFEAQEAARHAAGNTRAKRSKGSASNTRAKKSKVPASHAPQTIQPFLDAQVAGFEAEDDALPIPEYTQAEDLVRDLEHIRSWDVTVEIEPSGETSRLVFSCEIPHFLPATKTKPEIKQSTGVVRAKIKLDSIINPLVGSKNIESIRGSEHEEGFDTILIASVKGKDENISPQATSEPDVLSKFIASLSGNGKNSSPHETPKPGTLSRVIFQQGSPELDIDSLDNLPRADAPDQTVDFKALSRITSSVDVRLADTSYKLYLQPLDIPLPIVEQSEEKQKAKAGAGEQTPNDQTNSQWVVGGLVRANHFRRETWAFSYTLLITLAFVIALVALSWPLLKLLFIGTKDRLRLADVYFIAFALLIGSAVLTLFMLYGFTYNRSRGESDDQLKKLSEEIAGHDEVPGRFSTEVTAAARELDRLNNEASKQFNDALNTPRSTDTVLNPPKRTGILETTKDDPYPYFSTAFWTDRKGQQILKWTINHSTTNYISVKDRDYFKKVMEGNYRELDGQRFWLEPVNSRLTGAKTVVISKPVYDQDEIKGLVALDLNLMSLMQPVVPAGFGYRVIDSSGRDPGDDPMSAPGNVLFQSSESQQLRENFFEECDNDHALRSLVFGRGSGHVDVNYKGEAYSLYVRPIKGFPSWSLIVFRNKQPLRTLFLETLTLAGFIFMIYALILLAFFTVIYLMKVNTQSRTEWIWPSEKMSDIYYQSFFLNLVLCLLSTIVLLAWDGWLVVVFIGLIAFIGIFSLALRLKLKMYFIRLNRAVQFFRIPRLCSKSDAYIWNMVVLLVLAGVLPAVAFFKVAYNYEMQLLVKHGQITIAQGLQEREARVRSQYSTERVDPDHNPPPIKNSDEADAFIKRRLSGGLDVYDGFFFGTTHADIKRPSGDAKQDSWLAFFDLSTDKLLNFFNSFVPLFNQTSIEIGGLTRTTAADHSWWWGEPSGGQLPFYFSKARGAEPLLISTPLQRFGAPPLFLFLWAAGFLIILVSLFYLTRLVARKIFLLDVDETLYMSRLPKDRSTIAQNLFVVHSAPLAHHDELSLASDFHRIDLTSESAGNGWVEQVESEIKDQTLPKRIVVDHFEWQIGDPTMNERRLRLIEGLLDADKTVVVVSSAEPAAYSFGKATHENGSELKTSHNGSGDRWAQVVSRFRKVYAVENDDAEIEGALSKLRSALDADSTLTVRRRKRVLELTQIVREECAPRRWLQNIGREIIGQPGFAKMEPEHILDQILEQAELYYQKVWDNCSEGEKLTLLHLAEDRLLSPNDPDIKSLLRKGIIKRAPEIRLMNETFKRFVLSQTLAGGLEQIESQAKKASPWEALKVPLLVVFVGALLFLVLTQRDFYGSSLTIITGLTTGIPAFFKVLSLFQSEGASPKG